MKESFVRLTGAPKLTVDHANGKLSIKVSHDQSRKRQEQLRVVPWLPHIYHCYKKADDSPILPPFIGIDAASVACVWALELQSNDCVLDLCAAPGGKAMVMAEFVDWVVAIDVSHQRLNTMRSLLRKYNYKNIVVLEADAQVIVTGDPTTFSEHVSKQRAKRGRKSQCPAVPQVFSKVLVDAQCSHDGSQRHIAKFKSEEEFRHQMMTKEKLDQLSKLQFNLLENGWRHLDKSQKTSRLVYSTCSFMKEQNELIIERFLAIYADSVEVAKLPFGKDVPFDEVFIRDSPNCGALFGVSGETSGLFVVALKPKFNG